MLILINILIQDMEQDLILVHFFEFQILIGIRMSLFFGVDMRSSVHTNNISILGQGQTQGLDNTTLTEEVEYSTNFSRLQREFCLSLHYNESNSFLFVNGTKIHQLKAKDCEMEKCSLCLGNISNGNMKTTGLNGYVYVLVLIIMLLQLMTYQTFTSI